MGERGGVFFIFYIFLINYRGLEVFLLKRFLGVLLHVGYLDSTMINLLHTHVTPVCATAHQRQHILFSHLAHPV